MKGRILVNFSKFAFLNPSFFLAVFWCFGLLFSIPAAFVFPQEYAQLLSLAPGRRPDLFSSLITGILPLLAACLCVYFSKEKLLFLLAFLTAFFFGLSFLSVLQSFGSAGWLIRWLFQWEEGILLPVFYWYCLRVLTKKSRKTDRFLCLFIYITVICFANRFVSPFLAMLIKI